MERGYSWSWVEGQVAAAIADWNICSAHTCSAGPRFSREEQQKREDAYDEALRRVEREAKQARAVEAGS